MEHYNTQVFVFVIVSTNDKSMLDPEFDRIGTTEAISLIVFNHQRRLAMLRIGSAAVYPKAR